MIPTRTTNPADRYAAARLSAQRAANATVNLQNGGVAPSASVSFGADGLPFTPGGEWDTTNPNYDDAGNWTDPNGPLTGSSDPRGAGPGVPLTGTVGQTGTNTPPPVASPAIGGFAAPVLNNTPITRWDPNSMRVSPVAPGTYAPQNRQTALDLVNGATMRGPREIAGTDLSQAYGSLAGVQGNIDSAVLRDWAPLAGPDFSGSLDNLTRAQGYVNSATGTSAHTDEARARVMEALRRVMDAPDRAALGAQALSMYERQSQPAFDNTIRNIGKKAAAFGRIGSGITTNELGDVTVLRERALADAREKVALDASGQTIADRAAQLSAASSVSGQIRSEDLAQASLVLQKAASEQAIAAQRFGITQAEYAARVGERNFQAELDRNKAALALQRAREAQSLAQTQAGFAQITRRDAESDRSYDLQYDQASAQNALARAGALGAMDRDQFAAEGLLRGEQRTERDYQDYLERTAYDRRVAEDQEEQRRAEQEWERNYRINLAKAQYGGL